MQVTAAHLAPAFSCVEIVDVIYHDLMKPDDVFILSKGHGCLTQYVILEDLGIISTKELDLYCKPVGKLGAHPDYNPDFGIHASTGSLGHGLGIAVGQAYAEKIKGSKVKVYCVVSDGELQEGSIWEAVMMAANLELDNLIVFVDNNDFGGLERMSESFPAFYPLVRKFAAFGWYACEVDGHTSSAIELSASGKLDVPSAVICRTIKGKGVSYMEGVPLWHYRSPNEQEYDQAMKELADE